MRFKVPRQINVTNDPATTERIDMRSFASGVIAISAGTGINFYAAKDETETPKAIHDDSDSPVAKSFTVDKWTKIPDDCFGVLWLVPVLAGASSGVLDAMLGD